MPAPILCITCGYDLRTLEPRGDCPECATPIERSIHGDWLRYANETYMRRLTRGLRWLTRCRAGMFWVFLGLIVMFVSGALMITPSTDTPLETLFNIVIEIAGGLLVLLFLSACAGVMIIARPDPARESSVSKVTLAAPYIVAASIVGLLGWTGFALLPLDRVVKEIILTVCYATAWGGIAAMPMIAMPIEHRCVNAKAGRLRDLRRRTPRMILIFACLGLTIYWIGPFRLSLTGWAMPTAETRSDLLFFTVLAWIIAMGTFGTTRKAVEEEVGERSDDGEQERLAPSL